jgi:RNA polymerase sigma factor (sigma-70 family)
VKHLGAAALLLSLLLAPGTPLPRPVQADPRIAEYTPLAKAMAHKFLPRMGGLLTIDDLVSVGLVAIWRATERYDAAEGMTFGSYANMCVHHALEQEQLKVWRKGRRAWLKQTSIHADGDDDLGIDLPSPLPNPERAYAAFELATAVVNAAANERDRVLVRQLCLGDTLAEVGKEAGLSRERARMIHERALRIVRTRIERKERA